MIKPFRKCLPFVLSFIWLTLIQTVSVYAKADEHDSLPVDDTLGTGFDSSGLFVSLLKVILVLIIIIGLIYFFVRFLSKRNGSLFQQRAIRVISGVQLGTNKSLQVVEIAGSLYLLGVGDNVQLLEKITDPDMVAEIKESFSQNHSKAAIFPSMREWLGRLRRGKQYDEEYEDQRSSFHEIFQGSLSQMSERNRRVEDMLQDRERTEKERPSDL